MKPNLVVKFKPDPFEVFVNKKNLTSTDQLKEAIQQAKSRQKQALLRQKPFLKINFFNALNYQEVQRGSFYSMVAAKQRVIF